MGSYLGVLKSLATKRARIAGFDGMGLRELRAASLPGECPFCGFPAKARSEGASAKAKRLKAGKPDTFATCGAPECRKAYGRLYVRDRRRGLPGLRESGPSGPLVAVCNTRPSNVTSDEKAA